MNRHVQSASVDVLLDQLVHRFQVIADKRAFDTGVVGDNMDVRAVRVLLDGLHEQVQHD